MFANHACKIVRHISFLAKTLKTKLELSHAQRLTERKKHTRTQNITWKMTN